MGTRKTVLVVDDDPELRNAIRALLDRLGYEMVEASDGNAAMSRLSSLDPHLVCLDLVLPESSGYEVCEFIRRSPRHSKTPVLIMSERAYPEDRANAVEAGADSFIAKPCSEEALRERIETLLAAAG
jgi:two-component system chemotaxis response regulator CheY